jgi:NADH-ubiquinone oxidoreductase chain 4
MTGRFLSYIKLINLLSILVFSVLDILLFYISFEAILIPKYLIIGFYGSRNRKIEAKNKFFIYTLIGSLFLLLSVKYIIIQTGTSDYQLILALGPINNLQQYILWLGFFIALAVKMPMIPFHIWLPMAHTEANTSASVILAAILLKLGKIKIFSYYSSLCLKYIFSQLLRACLLIL